MISSKTLGKMQVSKQETSYASHSERFGTSCSQHDFFKNTREHAGFKTGNEPCFAFEAVWQAAIRMISPKTLGKMLVSKQETSHASHSRRLGELRISMISSKTLGKMQVSKQETSHASHSERFGDLRSSRFLQKQ